MKKRYLVVLLAGSIFFGHQALTASDTVSTAIIARVAEFRGNVEVARPDEQARRVSVKNFPLHSGDRITTGKQTTARIVFLDGTWVAVRAEESISDLTVREERLSFLEMGKSVERVIDMKVGQLLSEVKKNEEILTKFANPSGIATVKGTLIDETVLPSGKAIMSCRAGAFQFTTVTGMRVNVGSGDGFAVNVTRKGKGRAGTVEIETTSGKVVAVAGATKIVIEQGSAAKITTAAKAGEKTGRTVEIETTKGEILVKTATAEVVVEKDCAVKTTSTNAGNEVITTTAGSSTVIVTNESGATDEKVAVAEEAPVSGKPGAEEEVAPTEEAVAMIGKIITAAGMRIEGEATVDDTVTSTSTGEIQGASQ